MAIVVLPVDGNTYPAMHFDDLLEALHTDGVVVSGIHALNKLACACGGTSPVTVDTGAAWLNGKLVKVTASVNVAIDAPVSATRIDLIIVKYTYATGVAEVTKLVGTEGGPAPDIATLQVDGTTWAIELAQVSVAVGGVITLTKTALTSEPRGMHKKGDLKWWSGSLSKHYPLDPELDAPDTRWHICNGDLEQGYQTPDARDRMLIAAGSTYAKGTSYGSASKDLSHTHGTGTLAVGSHGSHRHEININTSSAGGDSTLYQGGPTGVLPGFGHYHNVNGNTGWSPELSHSLSGAVDSGGSAAQDVLNPCLGMHLLCRVAV